MKIRYKGIWHERVEDAPFIGALISAIDCDYNCENCFNKHVKNYNIIENTAEEIINEVKSNIFNQGVILAGLEWTLQEEELKELINISIKNNLKVILYTGIEEKEFKKVFKSIYNMPIYIKFGKYDETKKCNNYYMYGVKLASKNQIIKYKGE